MKNNVGRRAKAPVSIYFMVGHALHHQLIVALLQLE
jgi:hypothetical protein